MTYFIFAYNDLFKYSMNTTPFCVSKKSIMEDAGTFQSNVISQIRNVLDKYTFEDKIYIIDSLYCAILTSNKKLPYYFVMTVFFGYNFI